MNGTYCQWACAVVEQRLLPVAAGWKWPQRLQLAAVALSVVAVAELRNVVEPT